MVLLLLLLLLLLLGLSLFHPSALHVQLHLQLLTLSQFFIGQIILKMSQLLQVTRHDLRAMRDCTPAQYRMTCNLLLFFIACNSCIAASGLISLWCVAAGSSPAQKLRQNAGHALKVLRTWSPQLHRACNSN
jgi:hypothetical protein